MTTKTLDYLLTFRADGSQPASEIALLKSAVTGLHTETGKMNTIAAQSGKGVGRLVDVTEVARARLMDASVASASFGTNLIKSGQSASLATTAFGLADPALRGVAVSTKAASAAFADAQLSTMEWSNHLSGLRAQFNPLYAASKQYEEQVRQIAAAEDLGAISVREAAAARSRASQMLEPITNDFLRYDKAARGASQASAYYFAQFNDVGMMALMGQNPAILALQQGPQINQMTSMLGGGRASLSAMAGGLTSMLNPVSLLTIGLIGLGAAGVQALMRMRTETASFEDNLSDLDDTLGRMRTNLGLLENFRLGETFGGFSTEVRGLAQGLLELDRAAELKQIGEVASSFLSEEVDEGWGQKLLRGFTSSLVGGVSPRAGADMTGQLENINLSENYRKLGAANTYDDFQQRVDDIEGLANSGDVDAVIGKLLELQQAMSGGENVTSMSTELRDILGELAQTGIETARIEAMWNGSAQIEKIKAQTDQLVTGYREQAEVSETILRFGEHSAEVEALRNLHAQQGLKLRLKDMGILEGSVQEQRAMAALMEQQDGAAQRFEATRADAIQTTVKSLQQELAISAVTLSYGRDSAELEQLRTEHAKEALRIKLQEQGATEAQIAQAERLLETERERQRLIETDAAEKRARLMLGDLRSQAEMAGAILNHGRNSLQVKNLQINAARKEFEQQLETLKVTEETARVLRQQWEATNGLTSADPFGQQLAGQEMLGRQAQTLAQQKLELSLIGQNEATRRRILAIYEAEVEIRERGIDSDSGVARQIREQAEAAADLSTILERQADIWENIGSVSEGAIDGLFDSLKSGDFEGAFEDLADELNTLVLELGVKNPLKNALLGTELGTLSDVGGFGGIADRLLGGGSEPANGLDSLAKSAAAMSVSTPLVTIQSSAISFAGTGIDTLIGAANSPTGGLPRLPSGTLGGNTDVAKQVWDFFTAKGLEPHQVAGVVGNVRAESAFNPLAVGDGGNAFGLFQHNDRRHDLFDFIGGKDNLADVQKQLEFAWQELMTSENGSFQRLMGAGNVQQATEAFVGFERPSGWSAANPSAAHNFDGRLNAAVQALEQFSIGTSDATTDLSQLGTGFGDFGQVLSQMTGAGAGGGSGGDWLGQLVGIGAGLLGIPGFASGGNHEGGLRIVGENGPEIEFTGPSSIVDAETTKKFVSAKTAPVLQIAMAPGVNTNSAPPAPAPVSVVVHNYSGHPVKQEETTDPEGGRQLVTTIGEMTAAAARQPGNPLNRTLGRDFGTKRQGPSR